jgi:trimeric autotransporter adhesin
MIPSRGRHWVLAALLLPALSNAHAASFIYEGRLDDLGRPANGRYDLKLSAFGHAEHGVTLAAPITFEGVEVREGRFRLDVELPLVKVDQLWLEVAVRGNGEPVFSAIPGRAKAIAAPLVGACWSTTGDSGVDSTLNFIGTTDAQPFVVRTANARSLRLEPSLELSASLPISANVIAGSRSNGVGLPFVGSSDRVRGATVGGGGSVNDADPTYTTGGPNRATDHYSTVAGGFGNVAGNNNVGNFVDAAFATVSGGRNNAALGPFSTVGGGVNNSAALTSTVGGGDENTASEAGSTVGGGENNTARGFWSTVSGGFSNCAGGTYSWAGGQRAKVRPGADPVTGPCRGLTYPGGDGDAGTFAWADAQMPNFVSTGGNQFLVRAAGGVYFGTNSTVSIPAGRFINTSSGAHLTTGGTWTNASSRALKTAFESIDSSDVLARLLALPLTRWQYRESSAEGVHLGPVAEEFHAAFGLGADGHSISTVDANGVALAAIQGLNAKLEAQNAELKARLARLEAVLGERVSGER